MVAKVHGSFPDVSGTILFDPQNPEATTIEAEIGIASVSTGVEQRDAHLRTSDFFHADLYPKMTFKSKRVRKIEGNDFEVVGDLTIRGVTREVVLKTEITDEHPAPGGGFKIGVSATTKINREDYGLNWNQALEAGGVMVGREVHIQIDAELDRLAI